MNCDERRALNLLRNEGLKVDEMVFRNFCMIDETKRTNKNPTPKEIADRYIFYRKMMRDKEYGKEKN
jgi:hypothetical protein